MTSRAAPASAASAATNSIPGVSTTGNSSFGTALVVGRNRVPNPAAGTIAVRKALEGLMYLDPIDVSTVRLCDAVSFATGQVHLA